MSKDNGNKFENSTNILPSVIKDTEVVPVEVNLSTNLPTDMAEALAAANSATADLIHSTLDRFAATDPGLAKRVRRISVTQTFHVTPGGVHLDIETE